MAIVAAEDHAVLTAVEAAAEAGWIQPIMITSAENESVAYSDWSTEIIRTNSPREAAEAGADLIARNRADFIMKGHIATSDFLKPLLAKERGLVGPENLLSHVGAFALPGRDRLTLLSDAAIAIHPDVKTMEMIIDNAVGVAVKIGYNPPRVAVLSALEVVNPKVPSTVSADQLKRLGQEGRFGNALVSGPLALDNALSPEAAQTKEMPDDPVAGRADVLIVPDLVSGNLLFKSFSIISGYPTAGVVTGARVPIVLTSRADSPETKTNSIALACYLAHGGIMPGY